MNINMTDLENHVRSCTRYADTWTKIAEACLSGEKAFAYRRAHAWATLRDESDAHRQEGVKMKDEWDKHFGTLPRGEDIRLDLVSVDAAAIGQPPRRQVRFLLPGRDDIVLPGEDDVQGEDSLLEATQTRVGRGQD